MLQDLKHSFRIWIRDPSFTLIAVAILALGLGLAGSLALSRFLSSLLFGIDASDFTTFGLAALVLFGVALLSSYLPARRAMRIAPIEALRHE